MFCFGEAETFPFWGASSNQNWDCVIIVVGTVDFMIRFFLPRYILASALIFLWKSNAQISNLNSRLKQNVLSLAVSLASFPPIVMGATRNDIDNPLFEKSLFNFPPDQFSYPAYLAGIWNADFKYQSASFTDQISLKELSRDINVAGFRKYSVAYVPDIGADFTAELRFKNSNQGEMAVEDRQFNLRNILQSAMTDRKVIVESTNSGEKGQDGLNNPNRCTLKYRDIKGSGRLELFSNSRTTQFVPSQEYFRTFENFRQVSIRSNEGEQPSQAVVDYGLEWIYHVSPTADKQSVKNILADLKVVSYLVPQDNLYFVRPEKPVGVFSYKVNMKRIELD